MILEAMKWMDYRCMESNKIVLKLSARRTDDKKPLYRIGFRLENNIK
jgi:hypothetical protein